MKLFNHFGTFASAGSSSAPPAPYDPGPLLDGYANTYAIYSPFRLVSAYGTSPLYTVTRESDSATMDVTAANLNTVEAWLAGSFGFATTIYDQTGNARHISAPMAHAAFMNFQGDGPIFQFDGLTQYYDATGALAGLLQNAAGASVVTVRKHNTAISNNVARTLVFFANNAASTRLVMGYDNVQTKEIVGGRTLDADGLARSTGFNASSAWAVETLRADYAARIMYHARDASAETINPFQSATAVSNTASASVTIGAVDTGTPTSFFEGEVSALVYFNAKISDANNTALIASLAVLKFTVADGTYLLNWGNRAKTGATSFPLAPSLANYVVSACSGVSPTNGNIPSYRYKHHTQVAVDSGGRLWVAYSGHLNWEGASGTVSIIDSSTDNFTTSYGAANFIDPPSAHDNTFLAGRRISYPRCFVHYAGDLYAVGAIDEKTQAASSSTFVQDEVGLALVAVKCNTDGSLGTPFLLNPPSYPYTPLSSYPDYTYDPVLSPPIYADAALYGVWGGSIPSLAQSPWVGFTEAPGALYGEQNTCLAADGTTLIRIERRTSGLMTRFCYLHISTDGGVTWGVPKKTSIPNSPSETAMIKLSTGDICIIVNPIAGSTFRDPLLVALFDGTTGACKCVYAVRQGLSSSPAYPNNQGGGAAYPGVCENGGYLYVSYSKQKQDIGVTRIPLAGLVNN